MKSPANQALSEASEKISTPRPEVNEQEKREMALGDIESAMEILRHEKVEIADYATDGDKSLVVNIKSDISRFGNGGDTHQLDIGGVLTNDTTNSSTAFPMYRITRKVPASDSMWPLPPRYEVSVADNDSKSGYTPLALVKTRSSHVVPARGFEFGQSFDVTPEQARELQETGVYINPQATAMLEEVHAILDMAVGQHEVDQEPESAESAVV